MKQTATEYLFEKLWETPKDKFTWQIILQEAKKKEKRQIEDAYGNKIKKSVGLNPYEYWHTGEDYYKETYEKK